MLVIDLDSHSRPRREDYVIPAEYEHLRPRAFTDSRVKIRRIFDNRIVSVPTAGEREVSNREGKSAWHAAEYDADVRYEQVKEAGIRSEEHTSELQSRGLISYAVFCL